MLKTSSKEVRAKINAYIVDNFDGSNCDLPETNDLKEICQHIIRIANEEKFYQKYPNTQAMLIDWMRGLPSVFNIYNTMFIYPNDTVGNWLEQTEKERYKYSRTDACDLGLNLVASAIVREVGRK